MSTPTPARASAPSHLTSAALSAGVAVAAVCFVVAGIAEVTGTEQGSGEMTDVAAVVDDLLSVMPWAWATLGIYAVVLTPVVGLAFTAWEYATVSDRRTVALALVVIAVLATSAVVAILR